MSENGVEAIVIDNDCNVATKKIVEEFKGKVVKEIVHHPHNGVFDWSGILQLKEDLVNSRQSDWFMLWDSDEIREAPEGFNTLQEAFENTEKQGFTAVNFDEYIFLPVTKEEEHRSGDFVETLDTYYFFQPNRYNRTNAWKSTGEKVNLMPGAGHRVAFESLNVSEERYALRHYLFLSYKHGKDKYLVRKYPAADLAKGWSLERAQTTEETFCLPPQEMMTRKMPNQAWNRSNPVKQHPVFVVPVRRKK